MLRAFNGECDVLISKVKWNNINQMIERMQKLFDAINKLGQGFHVYINKEYLDLNVRNSFLNMNTNLKDSRKRKKCEQFKKS